MKLYREKKKDNPTPEIPTTYKEIIDDLPDNNKTTNTGMFVTIEINSWIFLHSDEYRSK